MESININDKNVVGSSYLKIWLAWFPSDVKIYRSIYKDFFKLHLLIIDWLEAITFFFCF